MKEATMSGELEMHWIAVTGSDGRVRMEARWLVVGEADIHAPHAA